MRRARARAADTRGPRRRRAHRRECVYATGLQSRRRRSWPRCGYILGDGAADEALGVLKRSFEERAATQRAAAELAADVTRAREEEVTTQRSSERKAIAALRRTLGERLDDERVAMEARRELAHAAAAMRELRGSSAEAAEEVREGDLASVVGATTRRAEKRAAEAERDATAALQRYFDERLAAQR